MMRLLKSKDHKKEIDVVADLDHLRKLFIMPDSPDKFLQFGNELLDLIHNFFKEKGGIHSAISLPELAKLFSNIDIPLKPHLWTDILQELKNNIIAHSVKVGSPYYIGHMTSAIPYFMILLEMIIAALNQNQVKIETAKASTFLEREFISWIHRLVFVRSERFYKKNIQNPRIALGNVTVDGTISNLTALMVARNKAFPAEGRFPGIRKAGLYDAYNYYNCKKAVILVSKRGHYSIDKIARILGLGEDSVIKVPVDSRNKIDIGELRRICNEISESNRNSELKTKIISLIGIAGTTETGNVDNLYELKEVADEQDTFFHVDAAWGGSLLMVEKYRHLFKGIECADSVSFDAHKLLYSPLSMGVVIFRRETDSNYLKHTSNYIIRRDSVDQGRFSVEGSRPFSCLKPWVTIKMFGTEGFKVLFDHAFDLTYVLRGLVEGHDSFEQMNFPELFIFNYRFVPRTVREKLDMLMREKNHINEKKRSVAAIRIKRINHVLNQLNIELHRAIRQEDNSFVSRTILESTRYEPQKIVVLRALTINPLTTSEVLREIIDEQNRLGTKIYNNEFAKQLENL
jgi:glutamate decarboxylase